MDFPLFTDPAFYAVAVPAVLPMGISKSGFGAGFGVDQVLVSRAVEWSRRPLSARMTISFDSAVRAALRSHGPGLLASRSFWIGGLVSAAVWIAAAVLAVYWLA